MGDVQCVTGPVESAVNGEAARLAVAGRAAVATLCSALAFSQCLDAVQAATAVVGVVVWHAALAVAVWRRPARTVIALDTLLVVGMCLVLPHVITANRPYGAEDWITALTSVTVMTVQWYVGPRLGAAVVVAVAGSLFLGTALAPGTGWSPGENHVMWLLCQGLLSRVLVVMVWDRIRRFDRATAALTVARHGEYVAAARRTSAEEHMALLHDTVAATLTAASSRTAGSDVLPAQARADVIRLVAAGLLVGDEPGGDHRALPGRNHRGGESTRWLSALAQPPPGSPLRVDLDVAWPDLLAHREVPEAVRSALVDAGAEALRNVDRHAVTDCARVRVRPTGGNGIAVDIVDGGRGFNPDQPNPHRYGLRLSVVERMRRAGGSATVVSAPGNGTTVELRWPTLRTGSD